MGERNGFFVFFLDLLAGGFGSFYVVTVCQLIEQGGWFGGAARECFDSCFKISIHSRDIAVEFCDCFFECLDVFLMLVVSFFLGCLDGLGVFFFLSCFFDGLFLRLILFCFGLAQVPIDHVDSFVEFSFLLEIELSHCDQAEA